MTIEGNKLTASEGMTLTNGEAYGKQVFLGNGDSASNWREITDAEAEVLTARYTEAEKARAYDIIIGNEVGE